MIDLSSYMKATNSGNPVRVSFESSRTYFEDLDRVIQTLSAILKEREIADILTNKLQLSKQSFDSDSYYESATELSVVYKMASIPHQAFRYEKPVRTDTKKNPECVVESEPFTINVEAKCPKLPQDETTGNGGEKVLVMKSAGRVPGFFEQFDSLKTDLEGSDPNVKMVVGKNKDNTMKDFLQSAHSKFGDFRDENELNALFVALDDAFNMQEWWNYLFEHEGLLTRTPFADRRSYDRVDVVVLTNLLFRHKNNYRIVGSAWSVDDSLCFMLSNECRQGDKREAHRFLAKHLPSLTEEMKKYEVPGDADKSILEALRLSWFVNEELRNRQKKYYFLKPEPAL